MEMPLTRRHRHSSDDTNLVCFATLGRSVAVPKESLARLDQDHPELHRLGKGLHLPA